MVKNPPVMQERQLRPWVGKTEGEMAACSTQLFLPGKLHGQGAHGHSPWDHKRVEHN